MSFNKQNENKEAIMPIHEQRRLFRIDDQVYFDYEEASESEVLRESPGSLKMTRHEGQRFIEITQYFQDIDYELSQLTQVIALKDPAIAHFLNLMNSKIEFLTRSLLVENNLTMQKVNLSLGGIGFKTSTQFKENTPLKVILYTKPKMSPVVILSRVVSSKFVDEAHYRTSIAFLSLTQEQEDLLSQHILQAQMKDKHERNFNESDSKESRPTDESL